MGSAISGVLGTSNNFSAGSAPLQTHTYAPNIEQLQNQQQSNYQLQLGLANQLQQLASGNGPNPALQMLQQGTNRAIQQGAGQLASTRGISPALAQRLAAQFGAQQSQAAAGQGAVLGAQQQQSALGQLGGLYGQIQSGTENMYGNVQNAVAAQNNALTGNQSNINTTNAGVAAGNQGVAAGLIGGGLNAVGGGLSGKAHGGMIENYASGGSVQPNYWNMGGGQAPQSQAGQFFNMGSNGNSALSQGVGNFATGLYNYLKPSMPTTPGPTIAGGPMDMTGSNPSPDLMANDPSIMASQGAMVPGKAQVKGDSLKNDTVPAALSPGEIVIPRHITMSPNAPELAAKFVEIELARHKHEQKTNFDEGGMEGPPDNDVNADPNPNPELGNQTPAQPQEAGFLSKVGHFFNPYQPKPGETPQMTLARIHQGFNSGTPLTAKQEYAEQVEPLKVTEKQPGEDSDESALPANGKKAAGSALAGIGGGAATEHLKRMQSIYDEGSRDEAQANYESGQKRFDLDTERQNLISDLKNGKVDPNRYYNNMSTGQKISTSIGLILSGLGSGLTGKSNLALDVLNKHINDDIESQKIDLGKTNNLLSTNFRQTGDLRMAMEATRMQQRDKMMLDLQKAENDSTDPMVKQRAQALMGQIQLQNAQTSGQLKMLSQLQGGGQSNDPGSQLSAMRMLNPAMAKEVESRYVPGLGMAQIPIDPKAREEMVSRAGLQTQVHNLRTWAQQHQGSLSPSDIAYGKGLASNVQDAYRRANGQGVFREAEANFVKGIVDQDPSKFFNSLRVDPKYKSLEDSNQMALQSLANGYGIKTGSAPAQGGVAGLKIKKGWGK